MQLLIPIHLPFSYLVWRTVPTDTLFLNRSSFHNILLDCNVNPVFIDMLGFPNTGGSGSSVTYAGDDLHSFRRC